MNEVDAIQQVKETVAEKVVGKISDSYPKDGLKEIIKYKGNQSRPNNSCNKLI